MERRGKNPNVMQNHHPHPRQNQSHLRYNLFMPKNYSLLLQSPLQKTFLNPLKPNPEKQ